MLIKATDKWDRVREIINIWLKDGTVYCASCDADYNKDFFPCCDEPILETNFGHTKAIIEAIKDIQKDLKNAYASNEKMNFRSTIKLPKRLYHLLKKHFEDNNEKFLADDKDTMQFARKFPMFKVPIKM